MEKLSGHERGDNEEPFWVCKECHDDNVHPVSRNTIGSNHWHLTLYCPCCERKSEVIIGQREVDQYDARLEAARQFIKSQLSVLEGLNRSDRLTVEDL